MTKHSRPPGTPHPDPRFHGRGLALIKSKEVAGPPKRDRTALLPNDDPLVLIEQIDAAGGFDGTRMRMTPTAAEAFRVLCRLPPIMRTLPRLAAVLRDEWGKSPNRKTLEVWSSKYQWQELLRIYDNALSRYRLWYDERQRELANSRQARLGRKMYERADEQMAQLLDEVEADRAGEQSAQATGRDKVSAPEKTNKKKPSLNGMHALAFAAKIGAEMERVALGLPTVVTSGSLITENTNLNATADVTTLDEWRRRNAEERGIGAGVHGTPLALPAGSPASALQAMQQVRESLNDEEASELPEAYTDVVEGSIVKSEPVEAVEAATP